MNPDENNSQEEKEEENGKMVSHYSRRPESESVCSTNSAVLPVILGSPPGNS